MSDVPNITQNFGRPSYRPETPAGLDPDMRRMAGIAVGLGALVAVVIGTISLSHRVHHSIPVLQAVGPVRVKPLDPGGMTVAGAEDATSGVEALAPPAEKPALHALRTRARAAPPPRPAELSDTHPVVTHPPIAPLAPVQKASLTQALPAAQPRGTIVQLAAFDSQQAAEQDWGKLAEKIPGLFDGHRPEVERVQIAGHALYRLRTGFATMAQATGFCGKVRAKGGDCSIASF